MTDDAPSRPSLRVIGGTQAEVPSGDPAAVPSGDPAVVPSGDPAAVPSRPAQGPAYVCTWCALRFGSRADLDHHHTASVACRANQKVSSPLQTRYGDADMVWTQPGEMTLNRVRASTCRHTHPRARLVDVAGRTIGYQCGWCYGVLRDDLP